MPDDQLEFQRVYADFQSRIHRYLTRLVGEHEAEDLTQEVFLKVSQALDGFRGECRLSTWIYRIATNAASDRLRSSAVRQPDPEISSDEAAQEEVAPPAEQQLIRKQMNECIRGFVEGLPADYRTVAVLSEVEGLTNQEIAEVLGSSLDTVKIRLHRARARLRKELGTHCDLYRDDRNELACTPKLPEE